MTAQIRGILEEILRLPDFHDPTGVMNYGRIPHKVAYDLQHPSSSVANAENPANAIITPDLGSTDLSLSIWIYEGVPIEFREILFYHELKESEFHFADGAPKEQAHARAIEHHMAYARRFLRPESYTNFLDWQNSLEHYRNLKKKNHNGK